MEERDKRLREIGRKDWSVCLFEVSDDGDQEATVFTAAVGVDEVDQWLTVNVGEDLGNVRQVILQSNKL